MKANQKIALFVGFVGVIASIYFTYVIYYLKKTSEYDYKIWDAKIITASDFTIQIPIPESLWR